MISLGWKLKTPNGYNQVTEGIIAKLPANGEYSRHVGDVARYYTNHPNIIRYLDVATRTYCWLVDPFVRRIDPLTRKNPQANSAIELLREPRSISGTRGGGPFACTSMQIAASAKNSPQDIRAIRIVLNIILRVAVVRISTLLMCVQFQWSSIDNRWLEAPITCQVCLF